MDELLEALSQAIEVELALKGSRDSGAGVAYVGHLHDQSVTAGSGMPNWSDEVSFACAVIVMGS